MFVSETQQHKEAPISASSQTSQRCQFFADGRLRQPLFHLNNRILTLLMTTITPLGWWTLTFEKRIRAHAIVPTVMKNITPFNLVPHPFSLTLCPHFLLLYASPRWHLQKNLCTTTETPDIVLQFSRMALAECPLPQVTSLQQTIFSRKRVHYKQIRNAKS